MLGSGAVTLYPGNPLTVVPLVLLRRLGIVTLLFVMNSLSGSFHDFRYVLTFSSTAHRIRMLLD